jgi:predicted metal-binding membrane protein
MSARRWLWRHPEAWVLALSAAAWLWLWAPTVSGSPGAMAMPGMSMAMPANASMPMVTAPSHGSGRVAKLPRSLQMTGVPGAITVHPAAGTATSPARRAVRSDGWSVEMFALMALAMMLPATAAEVRITAARSLWRRRGRAIAEWIVAFSATWVLAGIAILAARRLALDSGLLETGAVPLAFGLAFAAAWQLTPVKRRALNACHRTRPLAPSGPRADRDCLLYGATIGRECVVSCGPMMAAMTLGSAHGLIIMAGLTAVVLAERFRHRTPRRSSAAALGLLAALAL